MSVPDFLSQAGWQNLLAALLHTLWQAPLIALALYAALRLLPAAHARTRYVLASASLAGVVFAGLITWSLLDLKAQRSATSAATFVMHPTPAGAAGMPPAVPHTAAADYLSATPGFPAPVDRKAQNWAGAVALVWLAGVAVMLVRLVLHLAVAYRLSRRGRPVPPGALVRLTDDLRERMQVRRRVRVLVVDSLHSPAVCGLVWPTLLIPASQVVGIPPEAWVPIIAHELAHIRRFDTLVNLAQMLVESVLFFNPAVWWISRQMRIEREACCDALAVTITGEPSRYARSLVDWAEQSRPAVAVPAFAGTGPRTLLDRARRLLEPRYRPELRVSWLVLIGGITAGALLLAGLSRGTREAVALAARILTPQERMQQLVEAQGTYAPLTMQSTQARAERATIKGTIRNEEGELLSGSVDFLSRSEAPGLTTQTTHRSQAPHYSLKVSPGSVLIQARAPGYAPLNLGPVLAGPGETIEGFDILVKRGVEARIQIIDESGKPVAGVTLKEGMQLTWGASTWYPLPETDESGMIFLQQQGEGTYTIKAEADGFERSERELKFTPGQTVNWVLRRVKPTTGVVLDEDGKPIPDASLRLFGRVVNGAPRDVGDWHGEVLATTDAAGRFTLDRLRSNDEHVLLIETPDARRQLVWGVRAGQEGFAIRLDPEIVVRGKIVGDLSRLYDGKGIPSLRYHEGVRIGNTRYVGTWTAPVEVRDKVGHFELRGLATDRVEIDAGGVKVVRPVERSMDELVIDLDKAVKRIVLLRFQMPNGAPAPTGTLSVSSSLKDWRRFPPTHGEVEIVDGQAEFDSFVGGRLSYRPKRVIGAWFKDGAVENIPAGDEPLVVEIEAQPAGAIVGRVEATTESGSGKPISVSVRVAPGSEAPAPNWSTLLNIEVEPVTWSFMATPLPLGGTYVVIARRAKNTVFSEPLRVDAATPIPRVDLQLVQGRPVDVIVLDPEGKPAEGAPVSFSYESPIIGNGGYSPDPLTDEHGHVRFEDINPDPRIKYSVSLPLRRDYRLTDPVPVQPGGEPITVRLERGLVLSGRVLEANSGSPFKGSDVRALQVIEPSPRSRRLEVYEAEARTDERGQFRFSNLAPGRYRLSVSPNIEAPFSYWPPGHSPEFTAGQPEPAEIRISVQELSDPAD